MQCTKCKVFTVYVLCLDLTIVKNKVNVPVIDLLEKKFHMTAIFLRLSII